MTDYNPFEPIPPAATKVGDALTTPQDSNAAPAGQSQNAPPLYSASFPPEQQPYPAAGQTLSGGPMPQAAPPTPGYPQGYGAPGAGPAYPPMPGSYPPTYPPAGGQQGYGGPYGNQPTYGQPQYGGQPPYGYGQPQYGNAYKPPKPSSGIPSFLLGFGGRMLIRLAIAGIVALVAALSHIHNNNSSPTPSAYTTPDPGSPTPTSTQSPGN